MIGELPFSSCQLKPRVVVYARSVFDWLLFALVGAAAAREFRPLLLKNKELRNVVISAINPEIARPSAAEIMIGRSKSH